MVIEFFILGKLLYIICLIKSINNEYTSNSSSNIFNLKFYTYNINNSISISNPITLWSYNDIYTLINFSASKIPLPILISSEDYGLYLIDGYGPFKYELYSSNINLKKGMFSYKSYHCSYMASADFFLKNEKNEEILIKNIDIVDNGRENITQNYFLRIKNFKNDNINNITFGILGLQLFPKYRYEVLDNFIVQLKKKKYIDNYFWNIIYNDDDTDTGFLNIGELPECYNDSNYYKETKALKNQFFLEWDFYFDEIYFIQNNTKIFINRNNEDKKINKDINALIDLNSGLIMAPYDYYLLIKKYFFDYYINASVCFENKAKINTNLEKIYFYCKKDKFDIDNNIINFPSLYFYHKDFNFTFELNEHNLFKNFENYYYFLVLFNNYGKEWELGKIFFEKYKFYFNQDTKIISFCSFWDDIKEENSMISFILLCLLIFVTFFFIGFYSTKKILNYLTRKKIKNYDIEFELSDETI